jgi:HlyD family secretion protein
MKRVVIVLVTIGLLILVGTQWPFATVSRAAVVPENAIFAARRGSLPITVIENGYLKAKNSIQLQPKFRREGTITWLVEEGTEVVAGDKLVEFDATELENEISEAENSLIQYNIELETARAEQGIQVRENLALVEKAERALEVAQLTLERYEKGEAPNELQKLGLAEEKARSEFGRAKERFEQVPQLAEEGFLTRIQVEEERIRLREAEINMENAKRELELYQTYTHRMELTEKRAAVKDGERELENARIKSEINIKEKQARVAQEELKVQSTTNRQVTRRSDLQNMTILAEQPGTVHYGDPARPWYRDEIKIGNTIWHGRTVITLPDLRERQVLVDVHEAEIDKVKEGMKVNVSVEIHHGATFVGTVTDIASVASSGDWGEDTQKTFEVEITLEESELELRAGISARVEILVDELQDVLYVPIHAVHAEEGGHFCFVSSEGEVLERKVKIGANNAHYVQVVEGLSAGERVLLFDPRTRGESTREREGEGGLEEALPTNDELPVAGGEA